MKTIPVLPCLLLMGGLAFGSVPDDDSDLATARSTALKTFKAQISPFPNTHCIRCHGEKKQGGVTFRPDNPNSSA